MVNIFLGGNAVWKFVADVSEGNTVPVVKAEVRYFGKKVVYIAVRFWYSSLARSGQPSS